MLGHHGPWDCLDCLQNRQQWANLNAVVKVTAQRETATGTTVHSRYYISSLARPAQTLLEVTRPTLGHRKQLALRGLWMLPFEKITAGYVRIMGPQNPGSPAPDSHRIC